MSHDFAEIRQPQGLVTRIMTFLGLRPVDKSSLCEDRMSALDHPATRRAIANLPPHMLRDIGAVDAAPHPKPARTAASQIPGQSLRDHSW